MARSERWAALPVPAPSAEELAGWEVLKDVVDELIDLSLNYRQSGHPGGSRSKVHLLLATLLSGAMRWDLLRPWRPYQDRFVLAAGHTVPVVYATLAALNEAVSARQDTGGGEAFAFPDNGRWALRCEDLLQLRHRGGLPGHPEMAGRSLFLKYNTGPSGHGLPAAAGQALALKLAGRPDIRVFCLEGEGGLTPGAAHETKNSAWGLGLSNLILLVDWNDFGIDAHRTSSVVPGSPAEWFAPYGWRVFGTDDGMDWPVVDVVRSAMTGIPTSRVPTVVWAKTEKGRGYGKTGAASHGSPWPMNSAEFWRVRERFMRRYHVEYQGAGCPPPADSEALRRQAANNLQVAVGVLRQDHDLIRTLTDRLAGIAASVPPDTQRAGVLGGTRPGGIFTDPDIFDANRYPASLWKRPGQTAANRAALGAWGAYVNSLSRKRYGRPLFIACSADLAESTSISGFASAFEEMPGCGWYDREHNPTGSVLPQGITEFTNAGIMAGLATVNLAADPRERFDGFWGACSTYGSFTYLKYGSLRLFSQLAQDTELRVGKLLYVAGHSGPETAEDSRTHFGIYEPGMMQLFPEGSVLDLHPWEYNEVPVVLAAALQLDVPLVALHLTRPAITIPDRAANGMDSFTAAAKGAYLLRAYRDDRRHDGVVIVRGTATTATLTELLPEIEDSGLNLKIVAAISTQLFARQPATWKQRVLSAEDRWNAMVITTGSLRTMTEWYTNPVTPEYSLAPDWDARWRTGGTVPEVLDEAHLSGKHMLAALRRFATDRPRRLMHPLQRTGL